MRYVGKKPKPHRKDCIKPTRGWHMGVGSPQAGLGSHRVHARRLICRRTPPDGCRLVPSKPPGRAAAWLTCPFCVGRLWAQGSWRGRRARPGLVGTHWFRGETAVAVAPGLLPPELRTKR